VDVLAKDLKHQGIQLFISGIHKQPLFALHQSGIFEQIGEENIFGTLTEALEKARRMVTDGSGAFDETSRKRS
jgi:SulP family sulfate permease